MTGEELLLEGVVKGGKIVPAVPFELHEGERVMIIVVRRRSSGSSFVDILEKTKGMLKGGRTKREDWYEQADLY